MLKKLGIITLTFSLLMSAIAQDEVGADWLAESEPAATAKSKKSSVTKKPVKRATRLPKKKVAIESDEADVADIPVDSEALGAAATPSATRRSQGADSSEGWIIRKTKDGIIKIPKRETFKFEGGEISGSAQRPSQTVLGSRPSANRFSLLPERKNYRSDILGSAGAGAVVGNPTSGMK
jgi:hypothetical protein